MSLSAPIFVEGYFTVTLSSAPLLLSTLIRCISQCAASITLQQAISTKPSILPRRHRRCLNPFLLLLNALPLPPVCPGCHRIVPAAQHAARLLLQLSNHRHLLASAWILQCPSETTRTKLSLGKSTTSLVRHSALFGINATGTCILAVSVKCKSKLLANPTFPSPPRSKSALLASRTSSTKSTTVYLFSPPGY
jgi:hypothetical protein